MTAVTVDLFEQVSYRHEHSIQKYSAASKRDDFLRFLNEHNDACLKVAEQFERQVQLRLPRNPCLGACALCRRQVGRVASGVVREKWRGHQGRATREADAYTRGDRAEGRYATGNCDRLLPISKKRQSCKPTPQPC